MLMATHREAEDLINIGAYKAGSNPDIDLAIEKMKEINGFLLQDVDAKYSFEDSVSILNNIFQA